MPPPVHQAPIALFAFNRLAVLQVTLDALKANEGVEGTKLFAFVDGPKKPEHVAGVEAVRSFLQSLDWPGEVTLDFSGENRGLAASIRRGVSKVAAEHGSVIVVEDDIRTHARFLAYMNEGLERYRNHERIYAINGMGIPERFIDHPPGGEDSVYFGYRPTSHGWATWHDKWSRAIWDEEEIRALVDHACVRSRFRRMGGDCLPMLENALKNSIDSWAIRWAFSIAVRNGLCVTPRKALSTHQATDDGTHVKGSHAMIEHEFGLETGRFEYPKHVFVHDSVAKSFARAYGPITELDFTETMTLKELSLAEIGGGIKLIDIGASGALNGKWKALEPLLSLVAFDPNEEECRRLTETGAGDFAESIYLPYAISGESGEATLYQTESIYCWSLLEPDTEWLSRFSFADLFKVKGTEAIHVKSLDDVAELEGVDIDAAKLDVQGLELPILSKAPALLDSVFYLETETGFTANYRGETRFWELSSFLQERGFLMFDINPNHRIVRNGPFVGRSETRGQPLWCEAVWLKDLAHPMHCGFLERLDRAKALRILLLCAVEGFYDYGWEVAKLFRERELLSESEFASLGKIENWELSVPRKEIAEELMSQVPRLKSALARRVGALRRRIGQLNSKA